MHGVSGVGGPGFRPPQYEPVIPSFQKHVENLQDYELNPTKASYERIDDELSEAESTLQNSISDTKTLPSQLSDLREALDRVEKAHHAFLRGETGTAISILS